jgi:hypothetical protein
MLMSDLRGFTSLSERLAPQSWSSNARRFPASDSCSTAERPSM